MFPLIIMDMRRFSPFRLVYLLFSVFMCVVFIAGIRSFIVIPEQARVARAEIEEMLRKNQEEAERKRQYSLEQAEKRRLEAEAAEAAKPKRLSELYTDASEMRITGIGDSVMLAALPQLYERFPNGYFDAVFGRTLFEGRSTVYALEESGELGEAIVYSLTTNSYVEEADIEDLIAHSAGRPTFWITTYGVSNDSNAKMRNVTSRYDNAYMIEWENLAMQHISEWILPDGLHPNEEGSRAYAQLICDTITHELLYVPDHRKERLDVEK